MQKMTASLFALVLSIATLPTAQANDGIFGYLCRLRVPMGFSGFAAEKIYIKSDLSMAVYESKQVRSNRDPSYRLAMIPTAAPKQNDRVVFYTGVDREERPIQVLFDLQNSAISLQKEVDSVGEPAMCEPTELEAFDWNDAENALSTADDSSAGGFFHEGEF